MNFSCKNGIDESLFLEVLLMEIRGVTISYSSYKKKEKDNKERTLLDEIGVLESEPTIDFNTLDEKRAALENIRKLKLQGHMIRSRARWIEEGEKPSKYFCSLESRNFLNKTIKKVQLENSETIIYKQSEILDNVKLFYKTLYTNNDSNLINVDLENIISDYNTPKLDIYVANNLGGEIIEGDRGS